MHIRHGDTRYAHSPHTALHFTCGPLPHMPDARCRLFPVPENERKKKPLSQERVSPGTAIFTLEANLKYEHGVLPEKAGGGGIDQRSGSFVLRNIKTVVPWAAGIRARRNRRRRIKRRRRNARERRGGNRRLRKHSAHTERHRGDRTPNNTSQASRSRS